MIVFLTGVTGFIGSHLAERLIQDGHTVIGVSTGKHLGNIAEVYKHPQFHYIACDLLQDDFLPLVDQSDVVIHCAARAGMSASWSEFHDYQDKNVWMTQKVLEVMSHCPGKQLIYLSSSSIYGRVATGSEQAKMLPCNPYGVTKAAGELLCRAYTQVHRIPLTIIRPFSVYGPRQRPDMVHHIFIKALLEGQTLTIDGDGRQARSNTYVLDLVDGIVRSIGVGVGQIFNLGGGDVASILELLNLCQELTGMVAKVEFGPAKVGDQRLTEADNHQAYQVLGWKPTTLLRDGLKAQVEWQRSKVCSPSR